MVAYQKEITRFKISFLCFLKIDIFDNRGFDALPLIWRSLLLEPFIQLLWILYRVKLRKYKCNILVNSICASNAPKNVYKHRKYTM